MPLNNLFTYLFRNDEGDLQFLYLVDERWPVKYTLQQKINMEFLTETNLNLENGRNKYYLTHKCAESAISTLYQNQLAAKNQIEHSNRKPAVASTSVDLQDNFPVASKKPTAKQVKPVNREQQNTKNPVVDAVESSSISNKETKVNQKAEKRKSEKMAFSNLVRETKSKSNVEATVSERCSINCNKTSLYLFFFQCCDHHKEVCALLKADEDKFASLIQAHVNTFREYNKKLEQQLHSFKTLVGFVVVFFCLNIL